MLLVLGAAMLAGLRLSAQHFSAALKDRMDFSLSIAIGSSVQVALFIAPVLTLRVVIWWNAAAGAYLPGASASRNACGTVSLGVAEHCFMTLPRLSEILLTSTTWISALAAR